MSRTNTERIWRAVGSVTARPAGPCPGRIAPISPSHHGPKDMPAKICSTGEQKALLVSLVLAHAELSAVRRGGVPPDPPAGRDCRPSRCRSQVGALRGFAANRDAILDDGDGFFGVRGAWFAGDILACRRRCCDRNLTTRAQGPAANPQNFPHNIMKYKVKIGCDQSVAAGRISRTRARSMLYSTCRKITTQDNRQHDRATGTIKQWF